MRTCIKIAAAGLGALIAIGLTGCSTTSTPPIMETTSVDIQGQQVTGVRLLQTNGESFCGAYRAENGLVVCGHYDLNALGKAGIPAAMAKDWKVNGLKGELDAPIVKVNKLAEAKGVKTGMPVREALAILNK